MHWIDPEYLPETTGRIDCFLQNADGEPDGLLLTDGTEVHFPPHMGPAVSAALGRATVCASAVCDRAPYFMIAAVALTPHDGPMIEDGGSWEDQEARKAARKQAHAARSPMEAEGMLRQVLHGPKGETRGLLLDDGSVGRFPPDAAGVLAPLLAGNTRLVIRGEGLSTVLGKVISVNEIGTSAATLQRISSKHDKGKPEKHAHGKAPERHGPRGKQRGELRPSLERAL